MMLLLLLLLLLLLWLWLLLVLLLLLFSLLLLFLVSILLYRLHQPHQCHCGSSHVARTMSSSTQRACVLEDVVAVIGGAWDKR